MGAASAQAAPLRCAANDLPLVAVINAGGTISMSVGGVPGQGVQVLLAAHAPDLQARLRVLPVELFARPPDSSNVAEAEWGALRDKLRRVIENDDLVGVVVTHGTDTMQFTATLMAWELGADLRVPVVFTGAHAPPGDPHSDAAQNLIDSLAVAAGVCAPPEAPLPPGVYALIGGELHLASRLSKVGTAPDAEGRYFHSSPEPVGRLHRDKRGAATLRLGHELLAFIQGRGGAQGVAWPRRVGPYGVAELLVLDPFTPVGALRDAAARLRAQGPSGLVVQGNFLNNKMFQCLSDELRALCAAGHPVLLGAREAFDGLSAGGPAPVGLGLLHKSLSHQSARLKLSWLLGCGLPLEGVLAAMAQSFVGEHYETLRLPQWIRYETFPEQRPGRGLVVAWPGLPPQVVADAAARAQAGAGVGRASLTVVGFGHGHLPGPNQGLAELARGPLAARWGQALADAIAPAALDAAVAEAGGGRAEAEAIAALLGAAIVESGLLDAIKARYTLDPRLLRTALADARAAAARAQQAEALAAALRAALPAALAATPGLKRPDDLVNDLLRVALDKARFSAPVEVGPPADPWGALLAAAPAMCAAVGGAVERGVELRVRTTAPRGETDNRAYEAGRLLRVLGVHSEAAPGWDLRLIRPAG